jgi:carboxyl-terminal processing protease
MRRAAILVLFLSWLPLAAQPPLPDTVELENELRRLVEVFNLVSDNAAEPQTADRLIYGGAIPGMLSKLDPHSAFFDPDQFEQLQQMQTSTVKGFGSIVSVLPGRVIVLQVQPGSPAERNGLAAGDEIVMINGIALARLDIEQLIQLLTMARQQAVQLQIRRPGTAGLLPLTMTPAELQSPSVDRVFLLKPGIGHVRANSFDAGTAKEIKDAIEKLGGNSLKGLVLDLRGNPGGVLSSALETASLFLAPGTRLITGRGRGKGTQEIDVPPGGSPYTFKLAVLIDAKSASGSEIVAGAVQDNDRGTLLGETSYGKGLVQSVYPLTGATGLALTTAFYYTPSGRSIQRPLRDSGLHDAAHPGRPEFKTKAGRPVRGGGGIEPDLAVFPAPVTRFQAAVEATASFHGFAMEWLRANRAGATPDLEITPRMIDEFQLFLSRRNIRPSLSEWTAERSYIASRMKQEILNLAVNVAAGDEVETLRDPVVRRAITALETP